MCCCVKMFVFFLFIARRPSLDFFLCVCGDERLLARQSYRWTFLRCWWRVFSFIWFERSHRFALFSRCAFHSIDFFWLSFNHFHHSLCYFEPNLIVKSVWSLFKSFRSIAQSPTIHTAECQFFSSCWYLFDFQCKTVEKPTDKLCFKLEKFPVQMIWTKLKIFTTNASYKWANG